MPAISKIRFTNIVYDNKQKRFNDDVFNFSGHNAAVLLENGGGKTVFIQCAIQAVIPHSDLGERKIKETLLLDNTCAHIAIEWILKEKPRKYCVTAVSLYKDSNGNVASYRFINEYSADSKDAIEYIPFSMESANNRKRPASKEEIGEYYAKTKAISMVARTFNTIHEYQEVLSKDYGIIASEWRSQLAINKKEGGVEEFFDGCATTGHLVDNLLIPSIETVIAGDGVKGFVKTLETQRDTFKEYNQLTRLISESEIAAARLNAYVKEYETLNERQLETIKAQRQAKALRVLADEELNGLALHCGKLIEQKEDINKAYAELNYKQESMDVLDRQNELTIAEKDKAGALDIYEKSKEIYDEKAKRKENILLHSANSKIKELKSSILSVEEDMQNLEKDISIEELIDLYEECACQLRGCYAGIEEEYNKRLDKIQIEIKKYTDDKDLLRKKLEEENKVLQGLNSDKSRLAGILDNNTKKINELKRKILVDVESEQVEDVLSGYNKRLKEIESTQSALDSEINDIVKRSLELKNELPVVQGRRNQKNEQFITVRNQLENIDDKIKNLSERLTGGYKEFYNVKPVNFYGKEKVIRESLETILYKASSAKDEALVNERLKKRLSDAYDKSDYFTGAPELYDMVEKMKNRYDYIQAGGQYINHVAETLRITRDEILIRFPFWHYAVIVHEANVDRIKIELSGRELTCPVLVLTPEKARELVEGVGLDIDSVVPDFWVSNLDKERFAYWKEQIKTQGEAAEESRRDAEELLARLREDANAVTSFFSDFPNENYMQLEEDKIQLENRLNDLTQQENVLKRELEEIDDRRRSAEKKKNELAQESMLVNTNRDHAQSILKMADENKDCSRNILRLEEKIAKAEENIRVVNRELKNAESNLDLQKDENKNAWSEKSVLQNEEWYKTVRDKEPDMRSSMSKNVLIEKIKGLDLELRKVSKDRNVFVEKISGYRLQLETFEQHFKRLKVEAKYVWDEHDEYYEGMEIELEGLSDKIPELDRDMNNQKAKMDKFDKIRVAKEALYNERLKKFKAKYAEPYWFQQTMDEAKMALRDEEALLAAKSKQLTEEIQRYENERKCAENAVAKLAEIDREFKFSYVEAQGEEFAQALNYAYNRQKIVEDMDAQLQNVFKRMHNEETNVNNAKTTYFGHCRREISDIRNRDKLIELVEQSNDYKTLTEKQAVMIASLEYAKRMARDTLAEKEEKMGQFINHLYTHVEKIAKELQYIPKKTRIRSGDEWKEIFEIKLPEWNEKEARMALHSQITYILNTIENNKDFKTEDGAEDLARIRAFIEKSLKTKQLLKKIMGNNEIRVKCRKVTNDNKISKGFCSWEESEKWSGGERWSKNMALFLGIQNYIAEKTEPDLKAGKSKSCVLLDNPFGKASSEHVLNPVFFIARELGFQIITVTAHAEGKFISDYFPIVYSLRLREATGGNTSVITKEMNIKHAYFEDKDPIEIDRLMKKEQLMLY